MGNTLGGYANICTHRYGNYKNKHAKVRDNIKVKVFDSHNHRNIIMMEKFIDNMLEEEKNNICNK